MRVFNGFSTGEVAGAASATQFPALACQAVKLKAEASNAGKVYIGGAGVTIPDGSSDVTSGWELAAGAETGWLPISNMNLLYRICENAGDDVVYMALEK